MMTAEQVHGRQHLAELIVALSREIAAAEAQMLVIETTLEGYRSKRDEAAALLAKIDQKFGAAAA